MNILSPFGENEWDKYVWNQGHWTTLAEESLVPEARVMPKFNI